MTTARRYVDGYRMVLLLGCVILLQGAGVGKGARPYLHPRARIEACPQSLSVPGALTADQALEKAIEAFGETGVKHLCICEVKWIAEPVSGYLVDALGDLEMEMTHGSLGEEGRYSVFRIGISDRSPGGGSPFRIGAGDVFAIVARGVGPDGQPKWYPPDGVAEIVASRLKGDPQAEANLKFPLVYFVKYFTDRERFASLPERFDSCEN